MTTLKIANAEASNLTTVVEDYEVDNMSTFGATGEKETEWQNTDFSKWFGYFNTVPDLKTALIMKTQWTVGKGYTADPETSVILDHISGYGKDTFDDVLFNLDVMKRVAGDSFAEIIRDPDTKTLLNLKPLDPGSIKIIVDKYGIIKRYEQTSKTPGQKIVKWKPEEIFHLSNNRFADQIHGISDIAALEENIKASMEHFIDLKKINHRQSRPMIMFKVGTDDPGKISTFISKMDNAVNKGENIYIPDDANSVSYEVIQVNVSNSVMLWGDTLRNSFFRAIGLPQIVPGAGGQSTESESKVIYLAFEQLVEKDQRYLELQIWNQLRLKINLYPPATLQTDLQRDTSKDGITQQMGVNA
jgi:hypothetical protein